MMSVDQAHIVRRSLTLPCCASIRESFEEKKTDNKMTEDCLFDLEIVLQECILHTCRR